MSEIKVTIAVDGETVKTIDVNVEANPIAEVPTILSPTGKVWMDRNLGAENVGDYGDLFQWGRSADGHQKRDSKVTVKVSDTITPDHDMLIKCDNNSSFDWVRPQHDELWKDGINNPCPDGFRIPTEAEWQAEIDSGFVFEMNLSLGGQRTAYGGDPMDVGEYGLYWTSDAFQVHAKYMTYTPVYAGINPYMRACGYSVRAIKE